MEYKAIYKESYPLPDGYDLTGTPKVFGKVDTPCFVIGHTEKSYKIRLLNGQTKTVKKKSIHFSDPTDKLRIEKEYQNFSSNKNNQYKN